MLSSCLQPSHPKESLLSTNDLKIVSLDGAISEFLVEFGLSNQIVGTDITSNFPPEIALKPKVGHNRNISAEGILSLEPNLVIGDVGTIKKELVDQLTSSGVRLILLDKELSIKGVKNMATAINDSLNLNIEPRTHQEIDEKLSQLILPTTKPKVLFIYARGTGSMMVAGTNTQMDAMINISGGTNAVSEIDGFKPLTPESLVKSNPDIILMFNSGMESISGMNGLLAVPGVKETKAGQNRAFISMEGQFLAGFGPRVGQAALELNTLILKHSLQ